jgi:hypothetical protein
MTTGESWNEIMMGVMQERTIMFQCSNEKQDFAYMQEHGEIQGCG